MSDFDSDAAYYDSEAEQATEESVIQNITSHLRKHAAESNEKLELELPRSYGDPHSANVTNRVADFLQDELKREVTHLTYRKTENNDPLRFDEAIQRIMAPTALQQLRATGHLGNEKAGLLVRNVLGNRFTSLKEIRFIQSRITEATILRDLLINNPQLQVLELGRGNGPFSIGGFREISRGLSGSDARNHLVVLDLACLTMLDQGFTFLLPGLLQCKAIQNLTITDNGLTKASLPKVTQLLKELPALSTFSISGNLVFKDAPLEDVKKMAASATQLRELAIPKTGHSGGAMTTVLDTLSAGSASLESLFLDLNHSETYKALEIYIPRFKAIRSLHLVGGIRNAWTENLTQAILRNTTIYEIRRWGGVTPMPSSAQELLRNHFQSNRQITKAKKLLQADAQVRYESGTTTNNNEQGLPLGVWPKALSVLMCESRRRGKSESAAYLILRSQLATWIQHSGPHTDEDMNKKKSSRDARVPTSDDDDGERSSKRQRLET